MNQRYCDHCDSNYEGECPTCPSYEELIEAQDWSQLAWRLFRDHGEASDATKASYLEDWMQQIHDHGIEVSSQVDALKE